MGNRLGGEGQNMATIIFQVGGILGQSVRVFAALGKVVTIEFHHCTSGLSVSLLSDGL